MSDVVIRAAVAADAPVLAAIYGEAVLHGLGTFEEVPPDTEEMNRRRQDVVDRGLPWLVAVAPEGVIGFAYAAPFRLRAAYRYTVEDSVYIAASARGRGVGGALLGAVITACERLGVRQMLAVIGDSDNAGSRALHTSHGFIDAGVLPGVGFKHDRWVDVVMMTRPLGPAATTPPGTPGLTLT